jgi:mannose-6-phosphate isomerase-like protein (cupin superfamily)
VISKEKTDLPIMLHKINLKDKLSRFQDHWNPRIIAELNGQHIKLAKLSGEFIWHKHDEEDEMFLVLSGTLKMELRDQVIILEQGESIIIPRGTDHRPVAENEVAVLLFEPASTLNTGDQRSQLTRDQPEWI